MVKKAVWEGDAPQQHQLYPAVDEPIQNCGTYLKKDKGYLTTSKFQKFALGSIERIEFRSDNGKPRRPGIAVLDNTECRGIDPGFDKKWW